MHCVEVVPIPTPDKPMCFKDAHDLDRNLVFPNRIVRVPWRPPPVVGRTHYRGNAEGSTLRRTLGCLLASTLNIKLRRVGSGTRYTFTSRGEQVLDQWMDQHAFVTWVEAKAPWEIEKKLLSSGLNLPLNVDGNPSQDAVAVICAARLKARSLADELDIVSDNGGPRRPQTKDTILPGPTHLDKR
jgi:hypothetical protein